MIRVGRVTRVVKMTKVVKIRPRGLLWITIQFLYIYTAMTKSEDHELDRFIWKYIHTHTHTHTHTYPVYLHVFYNVSVVYFYAKCVKCQSKI